MAMKALIEFSDRYSNKNLKSSNPYTFDNQSSKKSLKKKSESIDVVSLNI